jgi:hypothetical protein
MAVSPGGNVLYVVNSDYDEQWNGGTLQSYDLFMVRRHTAELINADETGAPPMDRIPFVAGYANLESNAGAWAPCFGMGCAPPVDSTDPVYFKDSAIIGELATDLQLAASGTRLFAPVSGNATVTWADVTPDDSTTPPPGDPPSTTPAPPSANCSSTDPATGSCWPPFRLDCGQGDAAFGSSCDAAHQTGNDPDAPGDTRNATMPGQPFGIALTEDGTAMAVTHLATTATSLLLTGLGRAPFAAENCVAPGTCDPSMQFVLQTMTNGGNGITAVPHDPDAVTRCEDVHDQPPCVGQAFLDTSDVAAEVDLLRYFDDDGSSLHRPFLEEERSYAVNVNTPGTDQRGIVVDSTPSLVCKARLARLSPSQACGQPGQPPSAACIACGQTPSRVFIASRAPSSLIYGQIGQLGEVSTDFDPDALILQGSVPLLPGPSKVYLAPVVDATGRFALRLFVVCYDSATIFVFDPEQVVGLGSQAVPEAVISVGTGPFAMAFDPFSLEDVAAQEADEQLPPTGTPLVVKSDPRQDPTLDLKTFRFGYLASYTNSYVQVIDLDDSLTRDGSPNQKTFEQVVFTLGQLRAPKGL